MMYFWIFFFGIHKEFLRVLFMLKMSSVFETECVISSIRKSIVQGKWFGFVRHCCSSKLMCKFVVTIMLWLAKISYLGFISDL